MTKMTKAQKDIEIKATVLAQLTIPAEAIQVGEFDYAIPTVVDNETRYAVISVVAKNNADTKTAPAFDPEVARQKWLDKVAEREANRLKKEAERAEKAAKKSK